MRTGRWMLGTVAATAMGGGFTCLYSTGPGPVHATVQGSVVRGPVAPACVIGTPCMDVPFSAGFTVRQGERVVARFRSGTDGSFAVVVPVGYVTVVPDPDAPILAPATQQKTLEVPARGLSGVVLSFDTGIR